MSATAATAGKKWRFVAPSVLPGVGLTFGYTLLYLGLLVLFPLAVLILRTSGLGFGGLLVLLPFGYVLTFGKFGFPELGAGGLGIASALMMWGQALGFALPMVFTRAYVARIGARRAALAAA